MNRYTILSLVLIGAVLLLVSYGPDDDTVEIIGYANDPHEGHNGTTFSIMDSEGKMTKAFYDGEVDGSLHTYKGRYSNDGSILFINEID